MTSTGVTTLNPLEALLVRALQIAELHLRISDDKCYDATERGRCMECLGCSVDMARAAVREALAKAGSGPL